MDSTIDKYQLVPPALHNGVILHGVYQVLREINIANRCVLRGNFRILIKRMIRLGWE